MADQQTEKSVDLISTRQPFVIQKVESNLDDKIHYQMETVEQGKHYRLKVTNLLKQGNYNGAIKCYTDVPEKSEVIVRVTGYIEGVISVKPLVVLVGKLAAQQPARSAKVLVVSNRSKPFEIKKLTYDEKLIQVKQERLPKEPGFSLEIIPIMENLPPGTVGRHQPTACMKAHLYGAANVYLIYDNGTTETTITTWTWTTRSIQAGDQIEFRVEGTDYYCKNRTTSEELGPYTYSSNLTSGGAAGLYIPVNAGFSFSSWSGGDVGAPASDALMGQIIL